MNKNVKGVIVVAILLIGGYCVYRKTSVSFTDKVNHLIDKNYSQGTPVALANLQKQFVEAWYDGAKSGQVSFVFNNKSYRTIGGNAVV